MVFQNHLQKSLDAQGLPINISHDPGAFLYILELLTLPVSSSTRIRVVSAFLESFRFLFEVLAGISCAGLLLSLTITGKFSLDRALQSEHMLREKTKKNAEVPEL
jgi:hypothetical protein